MKLKKLLMGFLMLTLVVGFGSRISYASDNTGVIQANVGGTTVMYHALLEYRDVRCGMTTQAHFSASAVNPIPRIGFTYSLYDLIGKFDGNALYRVNSNAVLDNTGWKTLIDWADVDFSFENGDEWHPYAQIQHCISVGLDEDEVQSENERNNLFIQDFNNETEVTEKSTTMFSENAQRIEQYGLTHQDFELSDVVLHENVQKASDEKIGLEIDFPENSDILISYFDTDKIAEKDNKKYKIKGYVIFSEDNNRIDSGIFAELLE